MLAQVSHSASAKMVERTISRSSQLFTPAKANDYHPTYCL